MRRDFRAQVFLRIVERILNERRILSRQRLAQLLEILGDRACR